MKTKKLEQGSVQVYDFGDMKLHAYQTADAMKDECFLLETSRNLIAIESPAFEKNIALWKDYVAQIQKPLTDVLISYHPVGGKWYGTAKVHATENVRKGIGEGGTTRGLIQELGQAFGEELNTTIAEIDSTIKNGKNTIGGVEFIVSDVADGYEIEIPAFKAIYTHMLGANGHSILHGLDDVKATLKRLEEYKSKKFALILSSHHEPETLADVDTKIAYVQTVLAVFEKSKTKDDFVKTMKEKYPNYLDEEYLDMTATDLFK